MTPIPMSTLGTVEYRGKRWTIYGLAREYGVPYQTIRLRLDCGLSVEEAVSKARQQGRALTTKRDVDFLPPDDHHVGKAWLELSLKYDRESLAKMRRALARLLERQCDVDEKRGIPEPWIRFDREIVRKLREDAAALTAKGLRRRFIECGPMGARQKVTRAKR